MQSRKNNSYLIYIVAGESSGDILGADLIQSLKMRLPNSRFVGIGGELMIGQGLESIYPMERLSVMGIGPILSRFVELLRFRRKLASTILNNKADLFIGIDAPVFNTGLELKLKQKGVATTHYVSPSVWAWREGRIHKIKRAVDLMLCLFPFELKIYAEHKIDACFVGHPLADMISGGNTTEDAITRLNLEPDSSYVALLPGSRSSELKYLLPEFIRAAELMSKQLERLKFILPVAQKKHFSQIQDVVNASPIADKIVLINGNSRLAMQASEMVLLASGTATLEATLINRPMVVGYKMSAFSVWVYRKLLKIRSFSLPNLLSGKELVPELMQEQCSADNLSRACLKILADDFKQEQLQKEFSTIHDTLKRNSGEIAANAVVQLIESRKINDC